VIPMTPAQALQILLEELARQVRIVDELKRGREITWRRGNDTGVACTVQALAKRMDDPRPMKDGVFGYEPLQQLWERIVELGRELDEAHATVKEKAENCCQLKTRVAELESEREEFRRRINL